MAASKYVRFGLRADKNLSDLPNQNTALANILDDLVPDVAFSPQDLKVIDDISLTDVFASDLAELSGKEVTYRPITLNDEGAYVIGNPSPVEPTVTIKDKIINRKVVLGDPPYELGGSGPSAKIIPSACFSDLAFSQGTGLARGNANLITIAGTDVFETFNTDLVVERDDYWIDGRFAFSTQLEPTLTETFGAIQWDGYLAWPAGRELRIVGNGFWIIERDVNNTDNWELLYGLYNTSIDSNIVTATATDALEFDITPADLDRVYIGMKFDYSPDSTFEVTGVDKEQNIISITPTEGAADAGVTYSGGAAITFYWDFGEDEIDARFELPAQFKGDAVHYRFTAWWPSPTQLGLTGITQYASKYITFDNGDSGRDDFMPYNYWYKQPQNVGTPDPFSFEFFKKNKIGPEKSSLDKIVQNNKPIFIRYEPKINIADYSRYNSGGLPIVKPLIWNGDYSFTVPDPENDNVGAIQVGDILIFESVQQNDDYRIFLKVYEKTNTTIFVDPNLHTDIPNLLSGILSTSQPTDFYVFSSIGLTYVGSSRSNVTATAGNAATQRIAALGQDNYPFVRSDIKEDNLLFCIRTNVGSGAQVRGRRITEVTSYFNQAAGGFGTGDDLEGIEVNTHPIASTDPYAADDTDMILIYSHRGLNDNSISTQCAGVYGKEVASFPVAYRTDGAISGGANPNPNSKIWLYDTEGINVGDVVQYPGFIAGYDPLDPTGQGSGSVYSTVASVDSPATTPWDPAVSLPGITLVHGASGTGTTANTITTDIPNAYTLIFIKAANIAEHTESSIIQDKNYCVLPLNTAPPFLGNDDGLSTSVDYPHLKINGDLECTGLELKIASTQEISDAGYATASDAVATEGFYIKQYGTNKNFWILID